MRGVSCEMMKKSSGLCLGKNYLGMPEPFLGELDYVVSTARNSLTFFPAFQMNNH